jgi:hypothetical protein
MDLIFVFRIPLLLLIGVLLIFALPAGLITGAALVAFWVGVGSFAKAGSNWRAGKLRSLLQSMNCRVRSASIGIIRREDTRRWGRPLARFRQGS